MDEIIVKVSASHKALAAATQAVVTRVVTFAEDAHRQRSVDYRAHEVALAEQNGHRGSQHASTRAMASRAVTNESWNGAQAERASASSNVSRLAEGGKHCTRSATTNA